MLPNGSKVSLIQSYFRIVSLIEWHEHHSKVYLREHCFMCSVYVYVCVSNSMEIFLPELDILHSSFQR